MPKGIREIGSTWISGSSVAALYGIGFLNKHQLWEKFKGIYREKGISDEALRSMEFGTFFEEPVAKFFAQKHGLKIRHCGKMAWWRKETPYFITHPDFLVVGKDHKGRRAAIECKCVAPFAEDWGEEGTEEIPDYYYFQAQSYFANGVPCDVVYVVCMKGNRVYFYEILPDDDVIRDMMARVMQTNDEFTHGIEPDPNDFDEAVGYYGRRVKADVPTAVASDLAVDVYNQLVETHKMLKECEDKEKELKKTVLPMMGDSKALTSGDRRIFYFQFEERSSIDTDALKKDYPTLDLSNYMKKTPNTKFMVNYPKKEKNSKEENNG